MLGFELHQIIEAVLALLTIVAGGAVIYYKRLINAVINVLVTFRDLTDEDSTKEEEQRFKEAIQELMDIFKKNKKLKK